MPISIGDKRKQTKTNENKRKQTKTNENNKLKQTKTANQTKQPNQTKPNQTNSVSVGMMYINNTASSPLLSRLACCCSNSQINVLL